ncbi:putative bactericidal permeability-increasing protein [Eutypa lata UCREL1]|uniref:Putative bactericidal permeability-increasing protein n=1 Tax=Eutypa lata (strain UCR-EL1) TaxID=1287681 RepID=M7SHI0_EUTLA|nr:putative bactericidal permeability-increasing protein [Eutypa lata UCREL1]
MFSSCFGWCKSDDSEREPLLPQYEQDTHLQRELYRKLHSYQMLRALGKGYMPSTEQTIINLRTLLASDVLNPDNPDLSVDGRRLVRLTKLWLQQFITLLLHKNDKDQLQDLIWFLTKSRISVDVDDLASRAKKTKGKADTAAAYQSFKTIGSLMFTNADFRKFLADLNIVGREVFKDSAFALSDAAKQAGEQLEPSQDEQQNVAQTGQDTGDTNGKPPTSQDLADEVQDIGEVVVQRSTDVAQATLESAQDKLSGDEGQTLLKRLQNAVVNLRKRKDYSDSVSMLSLLIKRYAIVYSRAAEEIAEVAQSDVHENRETDRALKNLWEFVKSFGNQKDWEQCEGLFKKVMSHKEKDPEFEDLLQEVGNSLQKLLTDPDFFNNADQKLKDLREKSKQVGTESTLRHDVDELLQQLSVTFQSVLRDEDVHNLITTTLRIFGVLSPSNAVTNSDLIQDALNVFIPLLISAIQYIPIPRLEISTPAMDLLLESLVIEPGKTVNQTSFLPYRLKIENLNEVEIRKARVRSTTTTNMKNTMLIKIDGLSARADEVGFWLRAHSGLLRLADQGIAGFALDERGVDVHLEVEVCRERLEQILTLRAVRVRVHRLDYTLRKSKLSWLGWLFKPLLRPLLKATLEAQLATAVGDLLHAANRELLFARERLRATRVANPADLWTFVRAVAARLVPAEDPDLYARVGVDQPGAGVFRGVYTPASVVKIWHEEAESAADRVEEFESGGWRNEVFDVPTHAALGGLVGG